MAAPNLKGLIFQAMVVAILLAVTIYIGQKPYYNWDMFPYMALTIEDQAVPFEITHQRTYQEASMHMFRADFEAISSRQRELRTNPAAFESILKYFRIKPTYLIFVGGLHALGFNLVAATYLPSVISFLVIGCLMLWWMNRIFPPPLAALTTLIFAASPFLVQSARYSSPDMLCAALLFGAFFALAKGRTELGIVISALAITVRPDAAIMVCLLAVGLFILKRINGVRTMGMVALSLFLGLRIVGGTEMIKEFLFIDPVFAEEWHTGTGVWIVNYLHGLQTGISSIMASSTIVFLVLALFTLYLRRKFVSAFLKDEWSVFLMVVMTGMLARYLLHPVIEDRFQIASYLLCLVAFASTLSDLHKSNQPGPAVVRNSEGH